MTFLWHFLGGFTQSSSVLCSLSKKTGPVFPSGFYFLLDPQLTNYSCVIFVSFQIYQIYARRNPNEVHKILRKHGTSYIILENSICYSRQELGCRLKDILDIDNGHELDGKGNAPPRFCEAIKNDHDTKYAKFFKKVFENRTFYLYQLINWQKPWFTIYSYF